MVRLAPLTRVHDRRATSKKRADPESPDRPVRATIKRIDGSPAAIAPVATISTIATAPSAASTTSTAISTTAATSTAVSTTTAAVPPAAAAKAAATAAAATTEATAAAALLARAGLVDLEPASADIGAVHGLDRGPTLGVVRHLNEPEPP